MTGEDGAYVARGVAPGGWSATVTTPGWYLEGPTRVRVQGPDASGRVADARLDLVVRGAGTVSGRVTRADGSPVSRARVWLMGGGGVVRSVRQAGRVLETVTGSDGGFALDDVPPAEWVRVRAALGDDEATPSAAFRLRDGVPPPFVLILAATGTIRGRVLDLVTRDPVAGARVRLDATGEPAGRGERLGARGGRRDVRGPGPGAGAVARHAGEARSLPVVRRDRGDARVRRPDARRAVDARPGAHDRGLRPRRGGRAARRGAGDARRSRGRRAAASGGEPAPRGRQPTGRSASWHCARASTCSRCARGAPSARGSRACAAASGPSWCARTVDVDARPGRRGPGRVSSRATGRRRWLARALTCVLCVAFVAEVHAHGRFSVGSEVRGALREPLLRSNLRARESVSRRRRRGVPGRALQPAPA